VRPFPPIYQFAKPLTWEDAIEQGKDMAQLERRRLDLGSAPITDVAEVIASQGIWTCAMPFPKGRQGSLSHTRHTVWPFSSTKAKPERVDAFPMRTNTRTRSSTVIVLLSPPRKKTQRLL
jgi:hypothetical protein